MEPSIRYTTTSDGASIAFCILGRGKPLVVLPSGPWGPIEVEWRIPPWRGWCEELARRLTVIRYDLRGTGASRPGKTDFGLESQVRDLKAVIERQGYETCDLLAAQTAGPAAIAYAARNPGRVAHLLLWCTYARGADYYGSSQAQALEGMLDKDWGLFTRTMSHSRLGWPRDESADSIAALMAEHFTADSVKQFIAAASMTDVTHLLSQVQAPTLVLQRRQLPYPNEDVAKGLAAGIPGAHLAFSEGSSMAPFMGDTKTPMEAIFEFIGTGNGPPGTGEGIAESLSARELEVLQLIALGKSNQEIADDLVVTVGTVKTHVNNILGKLDARNRTQAVSKARALDLIGA